MIPSLLQIPSAVSDSKLHSVLPNNGKGDFQFDRSTGATRINKDGLIEEVGYFSSELVQNGNFSELGSELITNGDFATNSDWTLGTGWSINNSKAGCDGSQASSSLLYQNIGNQSGKTIKFSFTVSDYVSGTVKTAVFGASGTTVYSITSNGDYTFYINVLSGHNGNTGFKAEVGFEGKIDNVSVKQVDPNDRWSLGTDWSYVSDGVSKSGSASTNVDTGSILVSGTQYQVNVTVSDITGGTLSVRLGGSSSDEVLSITSNGSYKAVGTAGGDLLRLRAQSSFNGKITSVSVVEVQGDRPRLSYDITNGVVEDKPHLLLEPSSTNSITFSNDLSQSVWSGSNINNSVYGQVGVNGTNNAWLFTKTGASNSDFYNTAFTGTYTFSFFVKKEANKGVKIYNFGDTVQQSTINIETGAYVAGVNTVTIQEFPNDWLRVAQTLTISNGKYYLYVSNGTETQIASSIVVQYFQIEQQAFPTTYIPTAGTTITRAAETCNNSKPSVNSTEGVLYAEFKALASDSTAKELTLNDGTTANRVVLSLNASNQLRADYTASSSLQARIQDTTTNIENYNKLALKFKVNDFELYVNGSSAGTDTSGSVISAGTLTTLNFDNGAGNFDFYGKVKGLAVYNEALSESQLMQLTGVTASSIYSNFVTRTASFTVEALNEVKKVIDNL